MYTYLVCELLVQQEQILLHYVQDSGRSQACLSLPGLEAILQEPMYK